ncbi:hypothetical protein V6Z11_A07G179300 [Gossypium hirsutum]
MIPVPKTYLFTFAINFFENLSSLFHLVSSALNLAALIYDFPSRDEHGLGPPLAGPKSGYYKDSDLCASCCMFMTFTNF